MEFYGNLIIRSPPRENTSYKRLDFSKTGFQKSPKTGFPKGFKRASKGFSKNFQRVSKGLTKGFERASKGFQKSF